MNRAKLLAQVGGLYYLDQLTQADIARRLSVSRRKVSELLGAARSAGIVRIVVTPPRDVFSILETEIEARFGLREVRVVPVASGRSPERVRRQLGVAAAGDFVRSLRSGHAVGLVGGTLLASMIDAVAPMAMSGVRVVQGLGCQNATSPQPALMELVSELARRVGGQALAWPAPSVVASETIRQGLEADPHISAALRTLGTLDRLYVELTPLVSNLAKTPLAHRSSIPVGHIALRHFDNGGRLLGSSADGHVVGITVDQIRHTGHVVALAHGPEKARAIAAALRTQLVTCLITDERTARAVAALPDVSTSSASHARSNA